MTRLAGKFAFYCATAYPGESIPKVQLNEMRRAYMAGAAALFGIISKLAEVDNPDDEDDVRGSLILKDIGDELGAFADKLGRGEA